MERLLVRLPNWLGDLLMSRPLLHALRGAHPRCAIAGVGPAALLELIAADGVFDRAIGWPAGSSERRETRRQIRRDPRAVAWQPRGICFDSNE